jgi:chemotaxis protein MotA
LPVFVIIGLGVVLVSVLGGFLLEGGNFLVLMQWAEFVIIGGAAAGALLISTPKPTLVKMVRYVLGSVKSQGASRKKFQELLQLLYEIFQTARVKGVLALEQHVEKPEESELFSKYSVIMNNHHALYYLVDTLKLMVVGGAPPLELENLLDTDLETQEEEGKRPAHALARIGDSLPGLGIVVAVLGIVLTMQAIGGPASEVGHKVGAALGAPFWEYSSATALSSPSQPKSSIRRPWRTSFCVASRPGLSLTPRASPPLWPWSLPAGSS